MTIYGLQVQHILKTYHRNIQWGGTGGEKATNRPGRDDRVKIFSEGRKNQIRQKVTNHVLKRLTRRAGNGRVSSGEETR